MLSTGNSLHTQTANSQTDVSEQEIRLRLAKEAEAEDKERGVGEVEGNAGVHPSLFVAQGLQLEEDQCVTATFHTFNTDDQPILAGTSFARLFRILVIILQQSNYPRSPSGRMHFAGELLHGPISKSFIFLTPRSLDRKEQSRPRSQTGLLQPKHMILISSCPPPFHRLLPTPSSSTTRPSSVLARRTTVLLTFAATCVSGRIY